MNMWQGLLFMGGYLSAGHVAALAAEQTEVDRAITEQRDAALARTPRAVVSEFLRVVRSGLDPARAGEFLAEDVIAHQFNAEQPGDVHRTPQDYAAHVEEFRTLYGDFRFEVSALLADGDRVYARWIQRGCHVATIDGFRPTRLPLTEYASAVYRVADGRIVEYWIQIDRLGLQRQLEENAKATKLSACA